MISWILYYSEALSPLFSIKKAVENCTLTSVFDRKEHFILVTMWFTSQVYQLYTCDILFLKKILILGIMGLDLLWVSCLI